MATAYISSSSLTTTSICLHRLNSRRQLICCKAVNESSPSSPISLQILTKRSFSICLSSPLVLGLVGCRGDVFYADAAILEADDDEELLERVKKDRKKRLERQGVINSSAKETAYLQDLVYKLSKVGQAIDNNDLSAASSVLGPNTETDWVQKANIALSKVTYSTKSVFMSIWQLVYLRNLIEFLMFWRQLSTSPEEKTEVDTFNSSLASLISSVVKNDVESSKVAFVSSASAFEKWTALTGLVGQLKGL
ncbi:hypothetical protein RJ641_026221 [Dillenia turbinata]|uniref:Maintenance of Photosystem II under High light 2 C-terminal domain-containing protein n=1 Tax=Dillenia turbinata TaxID=194707 RepID=A0AAN8ZKR5_9MAGN